MQGITALVSVILLLFGLPAYANSILIEELREIIAQRALCIPRSDLLSAINTKQLDQTLKDIDPYARYVPAPKKQLFTQYLGIEVFPYNSRWWVRTDPGGPGDQAGIPEIGELFAVNNNKVHRLDIGQISNLLDKAILSDDVILSISSQSGRKHKNYTVKPGIFQSPSITWRRSGGYFILRIAGFVSHDTAPLFSALFATLRPSDNQIIIDLRGCTGGDLYESIEIAGMFVPTSLPLVSTYDRNGKVQSYNAQSGNKFNRPICLLIDRRTASSAEIFAGILKHHRISRLVGERSFGKCVSQTNVPLSDGSSLWLTTQSVRFPDNTSCTKKGIIPDSFYPDISVAKLDDIIKRISSESWHINK